MKRLVVIIIFSTLGVNLSWSQPNYPKKPEEAQIISKDVEHFVEAFKALNTTSDTLNVLKTLYFDKASAGLKEYIVRFNFTPLALQKAIQKHPEVYARIADFYSQMPELKKAYIEELETYKEVLPQAIFPPTYLLIADYKGIAQASKYGQLVSVEYKCIDNTDVLMHAMLHELTHFQQVMAMGFSKYVGTYQKNDNMLDLILREGAADFITYYLVRNNENQFTKLKNYQKDESVLWNRFQVDLKKQNKDFWLNVSFEDNNKGNPIQLGYAVGYSLVKSYYLNAIDKEDALTTILKMEHPEEFVLKSQYSPE